MERINFSIKRYRSARTIKIRVHENGEVIVTAHPLTPSSHLERFVEKHRDWINERIEKISSQKKELTESRQTLLYRGQQYQFLLEVNSSKKGVKREKSKITVTSGSENDRDVREILEKWYKKEAKKYFTERVLLLSDLVDSDVKKVSIRSQRSRWGSCSSRLTISLNWRLLLCPDWVSDYVIYHELAHLREMNHSRAFWKIVSQYYPNYQKAELWLKENHQLLRF